MCGISWGSRAIGGMVNPILLQGRRAQKLIRVCSSHSDGRNQEEHKKLKAALKVFLLAHYHFLSYFTNQSNRVAKPSLNGWCSILYPQ